MRQRRRRELTAEDSDPLRPCLAQAGLTCLFALLWRMQLQGPLRHGSFEGVAADPNLHLATVIAGGTEGVPVDFVIRGIAIESFDDDTWVIASLARDVRGYDKWTRGSGHSIVLFSNIKNSTHSPTCL